MRAASQVTGWWKELPLQSSQGLQCLPYPKTKAGTGPQECAWFAITGVDRKVRGILTILNFDLFCRQEEQQRKILPQKFPMRPWEKHQRTWKEFPESGTSVRLSLTPDPCSLSSPSVLFHFCAPQVGEVMLKPRLAYRSHFVCVFFTFQFLLLLCK